MQILSCDMEAYLTFEEKEIEKFLTFCEDVINNVAQDQSTNYKLKSALHELLINSLEHGYNRTAGNISVSIKKTLDYIQFEISDNGEGVDLSSIDLNKTVQDLETMSSRGWGLAITNKMCDGMEISPITPKGTKITVKFAL